MKRSIINTCLILLTLVCTTACSNSNSSAGNTDLVTISIDEDAVSDFRLSEIFSDFEIIKLEDGATPIGEIRNFKIRGDRIYILSQAKIYIYSITGEFVSIIDKIGRGPDEYQSAWDFTVDDGGNILISDFRGKSVVKYDNNGLYTDTWDCGFFFTGIEVFNDDFYLFTGFSNFDSEYKEYMAYKFDNWGDKKPSGKYLKADPNKANYLNFIDNVNFFLSYEELLFGVTGFDTIFFLRDSIIEPLFIFDYKLGKISEGTYKTEFFDVMEFSNYVRDKELSLYGFYFMSTPEFLFSKYKHSDKSYFNIYDKVTSENTSCASFIDDLFLPESKHSALDYYPLAYNDSWYYFLYQPFKITEYLDSEGYDKIDETKVSRELLSNIRAEDNPVILRLRIKEERSEK